jgi:trehalose 6-phosphate synthase
LSRFAGAARECNAALLANPYDSDGVAVAIGQALSMPLAERRERHNAIFTMTFNTGRTAFSASWGVSHLL